MLLVRVSATVGVTDTRHVDVAQLEGELLVGLVELSSDVGTALLDLGLDLLPVHETGG